MKLTRFNKLILNISIVELYGSAAIEETLFRALPAYLLGTSLFVIILSTILFASLHYRNERRLAAVFCTFPLAFIDWWFFLNFGLAIAILTHFLWNYTVLRIIRFLINNKLKKRRKK